MKEKKLLNKKKRKQHMNWLKNLEMKIKRINYKNIKIFKKKRFKKLIYKLFKALIQEQ